MYTSRLFLGLIVVFAAAGTSCGGGHSSGGQDRAPDTAAGTKQEQASAQDLVEKNLKLGSELPPGWPAPLVPIPPGASAVASLSKTSIPGSSGPSTAVLYSAPQSPAEIQDFFSQELPKRGWTVLQSSPPGDSMVTAARGNGYLGVFTSGTEIGPVGPSGTEAISMQVVLTEITD
jgi:hypothetical protein